MAMSSSRCAILAAALLLVCGCCGACWLWRWNDFYFFFRPQAPTATDPPTTAGRKQANVHRERVRQSHPHQKLLNPRKPPYLNITLDGRKEEEEAVQLLLSASVHLVELHMDFSASHQQHHTESSTYSGDVMGDFCALNFTVQKKDPTSVPMFRHLVQKSPACQDQPRYRVSIRDFVRLARTHDGDAATTTNVVPLAGAIFHESRCGSTLLANALVAMNPTHHRVYSEAQPEMALNLCGDAFQHCSIDQVAELVQDVVYLMGRTTTTNNDDNEERRLFFKFHSDAVRNLKVFQHAFPNVPWLFVYRDPVHVMVSQFKEGKSIAKCVRGMKEEASYSQQVKDILVQKGFGTTVTSKELYCAATLASYCESALHAKEHSPELGTLVHYPDLQKKSFIANLFSTSFGLDVTNDHVVERIQSISTMYSKASHGRARPYKDDSEDKERRATDEIKEAARIFVQDLYLRLQGKEVDVTVTVDEL